MGASKPRVDKSAEAAQMREARRRAREIDRMRRGRGTTLLTGGGGLGTPANVGVPLVQGGMR